MKVFYNKDCITNAWIIVTSALKECSKNPVRMTDATGVVRLVRTILLAHLADYPEQQLISCASHTSSPISIATIGTFGSNGVQKLRTKGWIMKGINFVRGNTESGSYGLAVIHVEGTIEPIEWCLRTILARLGIRRSEHFLNADALHQWHKFFWDHIMQWAKKLIGAPELDGRYSRLQQRVGYRHFHTGFTHFSKHTFRESRDLQRSFVAVIAGHSNIDSSVLRAFRAIQEFIYFAQFETHTTTSLTKLSEALALFHAEKESLSAAGIRDGPRQNGKFNIHKLELMQHVRRRVELLGSMPQYSTDQIELCHIPNAKRAYQATNKKNFEEQMCRNLDRLAKLLYFSIYLEQERFIADFLKLSRNTERRYCRRTNCRRPGRRLSSSPRPEHISFHGARSPT